MPILNDTSDRFDALLTFMVLSEQGKVRERPSYGKEQVYQLIDLEVSMRKNKTIVSLVVVSVLLLVTALPALALSTFPPPSGSTPATTMTFGGCSWNNPTDVATGIAQLSVDVYPWGNDDPTQATQVMFVIKNVGTTNFFIDGVYFDDGVLLDIAGLYDKDDGSGGLTGVDFSEDASPPNLPSPNCVIPSFGTLKLFSADADPPGPQNGISPGEYLGVVFSLVGSSTASEVLDGLANGVIRIGIKAQGFPGGGSESFVSNNTTAIKLDSFAARAARGKVTLNWKTGTEVNNAGFNLYRSNKVDGTRIKVNGGIIAAAGEAVSGASYGYTDAPGYGVFYYWLEDVEFTGKATLHGPVQVTVAPSFGRPMYRPVLPGAR